MLTTYAILLNNLYDKLPWHTKIYGIGIYGVSCSPSVVVSVVRSVAAFVVLCPGVEPSERIKEKNLEHCRKNISKYAMPREIEFRTELPKTLVGKVAYKKLEEEEEAKAKAAADAQAGEPKAE